MSQYLYAQWYEHRGITISDRKEVISLKKKPSKRSKVVKTGLTSRRYNKTVKRCVQGTIALGALALIAGIVSHFGDN